MGLIRRAASALSSSAKAGTEAAKGAFGVAAGSVMADQWKEYFYCDAIPENVLAMRGQKRTSARSLNKGSDNIISSGSVVAVADGQCMLIVDNGLVVEVCAEPGEFVFDASTEPSILAGGLSLHNLAAVMATVGKRWTFGGEIPKEQRVYYFNTKELVGNRYGTPSPVPFRVVDQRAGIDIDISVRCFGEYSYRITNPLLFYSNVCGNITDTFERAALDTQLKTEVLTALQPAFCKISDMGIRYSALPGHTMELSRALNEVLSAQWRDLRGIELVSFGVSSITANEEDEQMLKEMQRNAAYRDPTLAAANLLGAKAAAMQAAAKNPGGAVTGFMGMNMAAGSAEADAAALYQLGAQQQAAQQPAQPEPPVQRAVPPEPAPAAPAAEADAWTCPSCGTANTGKFCVECGSVKPAPAAQGWTCPACGTLNSGKFCAECGAKKPAGVPQYRCDKCGWTPADPTHPPKFCPQCGDPFGDEDIV